MAHILVIDDEEVLLDLISYSLRLDGHTVTAFSNPREAIESVGSYPAIDLLLSDVSMKPISGFELVNMFVKTGFRGPVLFMSGYPALDCSPAQIPGIVSVIEKPFMPEDLRTSVSRILMQSSLECESGKRHNPGILSVTGNN